MELLVTGAHEGSPMYGSTPFGNATSNENFKKNNKCTESLEFVDEQDDENKYLENAEKRLDVEMAKLNANKIQVSKIDEPTYSSLPPENKKKFTLENRGSKLHLEVLGVEPISITHTPRISYESKNEPFSSMHIQTEKSKTSSKDDYDDWGKKSNDTKEKEMYDDYDDYGSDQRPEIYIDNEFSQSGGGGVGYLESKIIEAARKVAEMPNTGMDLGKVKSKDSYDSVVRSDSDESKKDEDDEDFDNKYMDVIDKRLAEERRSILAEERRSML